MSELAIFEREEFGQVRAISREDGPWFVAKDVCDALGFSDAHAGTRHLDEDEKMTVKLTAISKTNPQALIINESGLYSLILRSRKPEAKRFKKWVTSEVLPSIRKTGQYQMGPEKTNDRLEDIKIAIEIANALKLCNSAVNKMLKDVSSDIAPRIAQYIPEYAIDAPSDAAQHETSYSTQPLTILLKEHGVDMSAQKFNKLAINKNILQEVTRYDSKRRPKKYKTITTEGLRYGKNLTNPANPRETQPHWFSHKFAELLDVVLETEQEAA